MAMTTVPGAGGSIITYNLNTAQNAAVAQSIANALAAALGGGTLNVATYAGGSTGPAVPGFTNELVIAPSSSGGTVAVPVGYTFAADSTGGGAFTITGAQNFIGSNGSLNLTNIAGAGIDSIAAGDGADLFALVAGSTYDVAAGNGSDTFFGNGSGTMAGGTGSNLFLAGGDANLVLSFGHDTIAVGDGGATVATFGNSPLIFGGAGGLVVFGNGSANETVVGGAGPETIFGAQSGVYFLGASPNLFIGNSFSNSTIVGTTGTDTVFGGASSNETIFTNSELLLFASGSNDSATIVASSGTSSTLFGSAGSSITFFATAGGAIYAAGTGNETLNAAGSSSNNVMFGGRDPTGSISLSGGAGNDTLIGGTGSDTMAGGGGSNQFVFINGNAGGNDFITDFNANDLLVLSGTAPTRLTMHWPPPPSAVGRPRSRSRIIPRSRSRTSCYQDRSIPSRVDLQPPQACFEFRHQNAPMNKRILGPDARDLSLMCRFTT